MINKDAMLMTLNGIKNEVIDRADLNGSPEYRHGYVHGIDRVITLVESLEG